MAYNNKTIFAFCLLYASLFITLFIISNRYVFVILYAIIKQKKTILTWVPKRTVIL